MPPSPSNSSQPNADPRIPPLLPLPNRPATIDLTRSSKLSRFFGERPPDDLIMDQLENFFPGISQQLDQKPGDRNSSIKDMVQTAILNKRMSRASVRQSSLTARVNRLSQKVAQREPQNKAAEPKHATFTRKESILYDKPTIPLPARPKDDYRSIFQEPPKDDSSVTESLFSNNSSVPPTPSSEASTLIPRDTKPIRWQKGGLIGQGAFGKVYHALNLDTGEIMAAKQVLLGPESKSRTKKEEALKRELELLQEMNHEHIVRYLGAESQETSFNVFLEYVSGGSIASCLQKVGKFEETLAQTMTCQILYGLEYLHERNIIHRDIKGANGTFFDKVKLIRSAH